MPARAPRRPPPKQRQVPGGPDEPRRQDDEQPLPQAIQNRPHDRRSSSPEVNQSATQVDADDTIEGEGSPGLTIGGGGHA
jgi:hypothetical protein